MVTVSSKSGIRKLSVDVTDVHLSFRPSKKDLSELLAKCPNLKTIYLPGFKLRKILGSTIEVAEKKGVKVEVDEDRGRPIFYTREHFVRALELREMGLSIRAIGRKIGVPKSVVHYWLTQAKGSKTRDELVR